MKKNGTRRAVKQEKKAWERPVSFRPTVVDRSRISALKNKLGVSESEVIRVGLQMLWDKERPQEREPVGVRILREEIARLRKNRAPASDIKDYETAIAVLSQY